MCSGCPNRCHLCQGCFNRCQICQGCNRCQLCQGCFDRCQLCRVCSTASKCDLCQACSQTPTSPSSTVRSESSAVKFPTLPPTAPPGRFSLAYGGPGFIATQIHEITPTFLAVSTGKPTFRTTAGAGATTTTVITVPTFPTTAPGGSRSGMRIRSIQLQVTKKPLFNSVH